MSRSKGRFRALALLLVIGFACLGPSPAWASTTPLTVNECLARSGSHLTATPSTSYSVTYDGARTPNDHTLDFRASTFQIDQDKLSSTYLKTGATIGVRTVPSGLCVLGGKFVGKQSRALDWEYLKHKPGGGDYPAFRSYGSNWVHVNGLRIDNVMDAVIPRAGRTHYQNLYTQYIRDDCLSNDFLLGVKISDSLFDGCYGGFSQRPNSGSPLYNSRSKQVLELDRVLMRLEKMPGGYGVKTPGAESHGALWKWSDVTGPATIRNSVIVAEDPTANMDWPANVTAQNVTIVWRGPGAYPGRLPSSGVTVTTDASVWTNAKAAWLTRHGCTSFSQCNTAKLIMPS
jgi:hypothetical protein